VINIIGKCKWDELRDRNEKEVLETIKSKLIKFWEAGRLESLLTSAVFDFF
jgi:hypothetical protein